MSILSQTVSSLLVFFRSNSIRFEYFNWGLLNHCWISFLQSWIPWWRFMKSSPLKWWLIVSINLIHLKYLSRHFLFLRLRKKLVIYHFGGIWIFWIKGYSKITPLCCVERVFVNFIHIWKRNRFLDMFILIVLFILMNTLIYLVLLFSFFRLRMKLLKMTLY